MENTQDEQKNSLEQKIENVVEEFNFKWKDLICHGINQDRYDKLKTCGELAKKLAKDRDAYQQTVTDIMYRISVAEMIYTTYCTIKK